MNVIDHAPDEAFRVERGKSQDRLPKLPEAFLELGGRVIGITPHILCRSDD